MNAHDRCKYTSNTLRLLHHEPPDLRQPPNCKTFIFTGEFDCFTRPEYCREIANSFPLCYFTTIKNADHLFHLEQFSATAHLLYTFTQGLSVISSEDINEIELCGQYSPFNNSIATRHHHGFEGDYSLFHKISA
jgi:hypothetical protein